MRYPFPSGSTPFRFHPCEIAARETFSFEVSVSTRITISPFSVFLISFRANRTGCGHESPRASTILLIFIPPYIIGFVYRKSFVGDDTGIEARRSKLEVRVSSIHIRASIRASTTTNINFNLMKRASLPLPFDPKLLFLGDFFSHSEANEQTGKNPYNHCCNAILPNTIRRAGQSKVMRKTGPHDHS